ncbi:ABC transporter substrate-binding protein [Candidatus Poribacteria bacterium]|jgi:branched-chain amino acid transport system substrate-binding protein|nr:ABC transporter substrate-binding protein [Candidatus Poribacteria bacterium]MBT5534512.1 ABC transporter substrate-binding protein [Candidatus Poribacteria bacterium]MBT5714434.1 ABC transporter substrate-binding protein [Candidatus Poribacteria bacterium]MBT7101106.1 ABC transporter substrate-binding protein [Candidatus Poribacteria bacterium]MBT7807555.1 ABC transporter substrate-binding protein [Candidatus Poribacteria bacterium]
MTVPPRTRSVIQTAAATVCIAALAWIVVGCAQDTSPTPIRVGIAAPLTGSGAVLGQQIRMGAGLAMIQRNGQGGIDGRRIELVLGDDRADPDEAAAVANRLAADDTILAVIGHYNSACSLAGKPVYRDAGVLQFSPGSTHVDVCRGSDWTFRNLYNDDYQGRSIARYLFDTLGLGRVGVMHDDDAYGTGLKAAFVEEAGRIGLTVVGVEAYHRAPDLDLSDAVGALDVLEPDVIFIAGLYAEAASLAREIRRRGLTTPLIGADAVLSEALVDVGGEAVEGMMMTTPFIVHPAVGGVAAQAFAQSFLEAYGRPADTWAALAYDAATQILDAIGEVGADRERIRERIAQTASLDTAFGGITGATYFDENGDCLKPAFVAVVRDGQFVPADKQIATP